MFLTIRIIAKHLKAFFALQTNRRKEPSIKPGNRHDKKRSRDFERDKFYKSFNQKTLRRTHLKTTNGRNVECSQRYSDIDRKTGLE